MSEEINEEVKKENPEENSKEKTKDSKKEEKTISISEQKNRERKYKKRILKLEEELKEKENEYLKVFAEMENTKRRLKDESIKDRKYASQKLVGELIAPMDMLVQIVNSEAPSPEIANYLIGFKMIANQLLDVLKQDGLRDIKALNQPFDPTTMQAMSVEENADVEDNLVVKVLQAGYLYKDRVLRPAMVVVNKKNNEKKEEK
ncbi:MAG: nucleotide exchange factor GrpE [Anaeroplasmataceae bacterium]|nr:nucleotide exchange factor GrpE [Anaeroplasmataceae bacterium]